VNDQAADGARDRTGAPSAPAACLARRFEDGPARVPGCSRPSLTSPGEYENRRIVCRLTQRVPHYSAVRLQIWLHAGVLGCASAALDPRFVTAADGSADDFRFVMHGDDSDWSAAENRLIERLLQGPRRQRAVARTCALRVCCAPAEYGQLRLSRGIALDEAEFEPRRRPLDAPGHAICLLARGVHRARTVFARARTQVRTSRHVSW
jgi:hypothetical protein